MDGIPTTHACAWENKLSTPMLWLPVSKLTLGSRRSIFNTPSSEPVQVSGLELRPGTWPCSPLSAGVSGSDSFAIDPTPLDLGSIWEGHQSGSKTSDTRCHVNLPIPK